MTHQGCSTRGRTSTCRPNWPLVLRSVASSYGCWCDLTRVEHPDALAGDIRAMSRSWRIFRQEAVDALAMPKLEGAPLHLLPVWTNVAYWLVVVLVVSAIVYSSVVSVSDYAQGLAVV